MKTTSASIISKVNELALIIEERKRLDKFEKLIKADLKEIMGDDATLDAGNWLVLISARSRKDFDKDAIMHDMGPEWVMAHQKTVSYEIVEVKAKARVELANA